MAQGRTSSYELKGIVLLPPAWWQLTQRRSKMRLISRFQVSGVVMGSWPEATGATASRIAQRYRIDAVETAVADMGKPAIDARNQYSGLQIGGQNPRLNRCNPQHPERGTVIC